ncbi:hypothetical protein GQ55_1G288200 [Panicum hallii var. hallii]|uniref:Uncharacterized protein n=1 Tax=Panicum hallii var. hallii TaxID=1504633 RepID=A0A2T7F8K6_9POAL|nr:hypothetical protein GQ55_1G288200 [Panicum hallii var. hallii]
MGAGEDVAKEGSAAEAATSTDGELAGPQPVGQAGAGSGVSTGLRGADLCPRDGRDLLRPAVGETVFDSSPGLGGARSTGLGGAVLRPRARTRRVRAHGGHDDRAIGAPGPVGGVGDLGSPDQPERHLPGTEHVRVADQRPPGGRRSDHRGPEQDRLGVVVVRVRVDFQLSAAMRSAALLVMFLAATALIGERDALGRNQFRALMLWLAGCIGLFRWILSRR